jgi:type II secretory pathway component PulF
MSQKLKIYFAKRSFLSQRGDVYEMLENNLTETGSRKVSTMHEIFTAWSTREASRNNSIYLVHRTIATRLAQGYTFSAAIAPFIPPDEALILEAGEAAGKLAEALRSAQLQKKAGGEISSMVAAAMAEPAMSVISIGLTGWVCGSWLWPEMLRVVDPKFWPGWALPLVEFEMALAQNWQVVGFFFLIAFVYWWSIPRWTGRVRQVFDKVPPWSIYRDHQAAAFLGVLGGLLQSGMELDQAMGRIEKKSPPWLRWHIRKIRARLAVVGANPLTSLDTGLLSPRILDLIEDAARNRSFDASLTHMGTDALPIIIRRVKIMAATAGTVMTLLTGMLFVYQVAVQQSGTTQATNNFTRASMK